ncbi:DUF4331 domain-containing protein [Piscinibacter koreensis]|uniref:DUF4331 domain-containing protein n=1 Tax=Piscinibacter koreensis TaxID=2742824 RepID=A0A7Y6NP62_9BURK|nr:DUF4331 domain-containing protein [Schlegelella koreensis]NUZ06796.1 DUF4331 domain-containing protein [Schlegelella koreensis]
MNTSNPRARARLLPIAAALLGSIALPAVASSHREAPSITTTPKLDATDFYMFNSYEAGRAGHVTLIANYLPLQQPYGGPNYFKLDPNALYEIHVDNNGDAKEDITFQFRFKNTLKGTQLNIGGRMVAIPLTQSGQVSAPGAAALNVNETFTVDIVRGDRRTGTRASLTRVGGGATFDKPSDNIGTKTIPNYAAYAGQHVYSVNIPGCSAPGKLFVGQRKDPFAVNLGVIFDLLNVPGAADFTPAEAAFVLDASKKDAGVDDLASANVTSLAVEVPTACLLAAGGGDPVIGGWTSASLRQGQLLSGNPKAGYQTATLAGGAWTQVSRLGMPLVNEVVIGLPDKDRFNASKPRDDSQFAAYVTNPTLPALLEIALATPGIAPTNFPRNDLVTTFLTGIAGVNQPKAFAASPASGVASEMLRLNTAIAPTPAAQQNRLGLLGGLLGPAPQDLAGYPNGRRPNDDVVDISLIAMMGGLCVANGNADTYKFGAACRPAAAPLGNAVFNLHDGVDQAGPKVRANGPLLPAFPYVGTPLPGAN